MLLILKTMKTNLHIQLILVLIIIILFSHESYNYDNFFIVVWTFYKDEDNLLQVFAADRSR